VKSAHNELIKEPEITESYLNSQLDKSIFDMDFKSYTFKSLYVYTYYYICNFIGYLLNYNNPTNITNKKYIQAIVDKNQIEEIEKQVEQTSRSFFLNTKIIKNNPFMKEIIEKTESVTNIDSVGHYYLTKYVRGCCLINAKLSKGFSISEDEIKLVNSINSVIDQVEPLSYPVTLFHGFEFYTKYSDYKVGDIIGVGGFLSKTLSFNVALSFSQSLNLLNPNLLIVHYPTGSKQVHHDIRPFNNEFEFLTKSDEKLQVKNIINYYDLKNYNIIPVHFTFYICEPVN
jgi:hypothetical protein